MFQEKIHVKEENEKIAVPMNTHQPIHVKRMITQMQPVHVK